MYFLPQTTVCVSSYYYVCPHTIICPHTAIGVLTLLYICVLMRVKGPTNAYVWHTWVLGEVGDVCAVVELGKLEGKHLSMMLSLVSTDPALP